MIKKIIYVNERRVFIFITHKKILKMTTSMINFNPHNHISIMRKEEKKTSTTTKMY
jgi:hypothetical protein